MIKKIGRVTKGMLAGMILLLLCTACASAQDRIEEGVTLLTDNMKAQLTLTDAQYKKIYAINLDFINQLKTIKQFAGSKSDKLDKAKKMDEARDAKIKPLLSAKQYEQYLAMKKENRKKMKEYIRQQKADKL